MSKKILNNLLTVLLILIAMTGTGFSDSVSAENHNLILFVNAGYLRCLMCHSGLLNLNKFIIEKGLAANCVAVIFGVSKEAAESSLSERKVLNQIKAIVRNLNFCFPVSFFNEDEGDLFNGIDDYLLLIIEKQNGRAFILTHPSDPQQIEEIVSKKDSLPN